MVGLGFVRGRGGLLTICSSRVGAYLRGANLRIYGIELYLSMGVYFIYK